MINPKVREQFPGTLPMGICRHCGVVADDPARLAAALRLILPMVKGYAAAHPVGSNADYVAIAQDVVDTWNTWEEDGDDDKMCFPCAEAYEILLDQARTELKSEESFIALKTNHDEDLAVFARAEELWQEQQNIPVANEEEVSLTIAGVEDDTEFNALYDDWAVKDEIGMPPTTLRTICHIWFNRGVARGTQWTSSEIDRVASARKSG